MLGDGGWRSQGRNAKEAPSPSRRNLFLGKDFALRWVLRRWKASTTHPRMALHPFEQLWSVHLEPQASVRGSRSSHSASHNTGKPPSRRTKTMATFSMGPADRQVPSKFIKSSISRRDSWPPGNSKDANHTQRPRTVLIKRTKWISINAFRRRREAARRAPSIRSPEQNAPWNAATACPGKGRPTGEPR